MKEVFTKWQAWCDLILIAYHSPTDMFIRNVKIRAKRGNVYMSVHELAGRWRWSRGKVDRFLRYLETDGRIKVNPSNIINSITILNYEKFQQNAPNGRVKANEALFAESPPTDVGGDLLNKLLAEMSELKERLDSQEQPDKKRARKKEPNQFIVKGREVFESRYFDLFNDSYYWQAKDAVAMDALTKKIIYSRTQKGMSVEIEDVIKALEALLQSVKDDWLLSNFSVTNINSKYNEIVAQARALKTNESKNRENRRRSSEVTATDAKDYDGTF